MKLEPEYVYERAEGGWAAGMDAPPGVHAHGDTREEAVHRWREATAEILAGDPSRFDCEKLVCEIIAMHEDGQREYALTGSRDPICAARSAMVERLYEMAHRWCDGAIERGAVAAEAWGNRLHTPDERGIALHAARRTRSAKSGHHG